MKNVTVWAESSAEIEDFIVLLKKEARFNIKSVFVAKRGIGNNYLAGTYFPYDLKLKACLAKEAKAPKFIVDLVQWCSPDIIIADDKQAFLSIETTYHTLTYNNIAQRIPRQVRSSIKSVPNVIFQKIENRNIETTKIWFCKSFMSTDYIYKIPSLAILFTEKDFDNKRKQLVKLCNVMINGEDSKEIVNQIKTDMEFFASKYDPKSVLYTKKGDLRNWIRDKKDKVIVIIGVKPEGTGWKTKGTGLMDPYPGLVKMSELLFCFNVNGKRTKKLWTYFKFLPRDFWWFEKFPNELYYSIIKEFSNKVYYKGELKDD